MLVMTTTKLTASEQLSRMPALTRWLGLFLVMLFLSFSLSSWDALAAQKVRPAAKFDHTKTGFLLSGVHEKTKCESCHVKGVFKGTPKECSGCHVQGGRVAASIKTSKHIPTDDKCETCHKSSGWLPASFSHSKVEPGSCATCHNNTNERGKPNPHAQTNASCDVCHKTSAWLPAAGHDHKDAVPGDCKSCHGKTAKGKSANHISTDLSCDSCHKGFVSFAGGKRPHTNADKGQCTSCHLTKALATANHLDSSKLSCDTCHTSDAGAGQWSKPPKPNHASLPTTCETCHGSTKFAGVLNHAGSHHVGETCTTCHASPNNPFSAAKRKHTSADKGQCTSCHIAKALATANHLDSSKLSCDTCHTSDAGAGQWNKPPKPNHTLLPTSCETCHGNTKFVGVLNNPNHHVGETCTTCHTSPNNPFSAGKRKHTSADKGQCTSCHISKALATANHLDSSAISCDTCHASDASAGKWNKPPKPNHTLLPTSCET